MLVREDCRGTFLDRNGGIGHGTHDGRFSREPFLKLRNSDTRANSNHNQLLRGTGCLESLSYLVANLRCAVRFCRNHHDVGASHVIVERPDEGILVVSSHEGRGIILSQAVKSFGATTSQGQSVGS